MHYDRGRRAHPHDVPSRAARRAPRNIVEEPVATERHTIAPEEAGLRLDVAVARLSGAPRSRVAEAIDAGDVLLNGVPQKAATPVVAGDVLDFVVTPRPKLEAQPQDLPLHVVYEDDDVIVVDKPAGVVTHPAHGAREGTLVNALLAHAGRLPGDPLRPGLVHRLDRDTSGLLVVAKNETALRALGKAMMRRHIEREYLGLVVGTPERPEGTIEGAIGRDPHNRMRYAIRADGKPAVTNYALREPLKGASELLFRLETGRTHQIRVHLAAFGHPIVNDALYGRSDRRSPLPGQALHAWRLRFRHPQTREDLVFESAPPPAYERTKDLFRP